MSREALYTWLLPTPAERRQTLALLGGTLICALVAGAILLGRSWSPAPTAPAWAPIYVERFDRPEVLTRTTRAAPDLGYESSERAWVVKEGRLWGEMGHNAALWFTDLTLPDQVRVELSARAETDTGDLKCELFGDGQTHQSGLILINGGWHNKLRVIARRDEHGEDRKEDRACGPRCAPKGVEQRWVIERRDGVISWYIDDKLALRWRETAPLIGRRLAFNHWEAKVSYDDLVVYNLSGP